MSAHEMQIEMQQGARQKGKVEAEFHIVIQNPVRMPSGLAVSRGGGWGGGGGGVGSRAEGSSSQHTSSYF